VFERALRFRGLAISTAGGELLGAGPMNRAPLCSIHGRAQRRITVGMQKKIGLERRVFVGLETCGNQLAAPVVGSHSDGAR
jgi:hypothetical protein